MMNFITAFSCLALIVSSLALPIDQAARDARSAFFLLAGDSTTALLNPSGGGWGQGFLSTTLRPPASGIDLGHDGATTVSFVQGGYWAQVLSNITTHRNAYEVFTTIQFGHNDQKPAANISLAEFASNLGNMVDDVRSAGATPILVTPLTRRTFNYSFAPPQVVESLAEQRNATIAVAIQKESRWIDLNLASQQYCNEIGPAAAWAYNLNDTVNDITHLNDWVSNWREWKFGGMCADVLIFAALG
jgi:lysophospholipase L1-like esterase